MRTDPHKTGLSNEIITELENFSENIDIHHLQRSLRTVVFEYLSVKHDDLIPDFGSFIEELSYLFDFLDRVVDESNG